MEVKNNLVNSEGEYQVRTNQEINNLYGEATIIDVLKSSRLSWVVHVWRSGKII